MSLADAQSAIRKRQDAVAERRAWVQHYKERGLSELEADKAASREMGKAAVVGGLKSLAQKADSHFRNMVQGGGMYGGGGSLLGGGPQPARKPKKQKAWDMFGSHI